MAEYRTTHTDRGNEYAKLIAGEWVDISEEEAKSAGVWHDPRGGQYGVRDELATSDELAARDKGIYDPRPASGARIAKRLTLLCGRCLTPLGEVHDFEKRPLYYSHRSHAWTRAPGKLKCRECFGPLDYFGMDLAEIEHELELARTRSKTRNVKIGAMSSKLRRQADEFYSKFDGE